MEFRQLGKAGPRSSAIGICPGDGPARDRVVQRALGLGCRLFWSRERIEGSLTLPDLPGVGLVRYNLLDQKDANREIPRLAREGRGVIATHALAGGALAGKVVHAPRGARIAQLRCLVKPRRTLAQAALQFVLANESVHAVMVRVSSVEHLEEVVGALDAEPLTGQDLEQIFELWANRFE
jgi:aryl-alcohol dehydrogenase-like predicted oxidoreductase